MTGASRTHQIHLLLAKVERLLESANRSLHFHVIRDGSAEPGLLNDAHVMK